LLHANLETCIFDRLRGAGDSRDTHPLVADDAAGSRSLLTPNLELGFDERHERTARAGTVRDCGHQLGKPDERRVDDGEITGATNHVRRERPRVGSFHDRDARIDAELVGKLPVAHVNRKYPRRSSLEKAVGKATRRGAEVETTQATDVETEGIERSSQFDAASRNVRTRGSANLDHGIVGNQDAGLVDTPSVHEHFAGEHHAERARAGERQLAVNEQLVESNFGHTDSRVPSAGSSPHEPVFVELLDEGGPRNAQTASRLTLVSASGLEGFGNERSLEGLDARSKRVPSSWIARSA
jgi:hypothetical protein